MKQFVQICFASCLVALFGTSVYAQPFQDGKDALDQAESFYAGACGQALKGALKNGEKDAQKAKQACRAFKSCKQNCRTKRKSDKKACRGKKGKAKRNCKRSANKSKRKCVKACRKTAKSKSCKKARSALTKALRKSAKALAKNPECKDFARKAADAIKASAQ